MLSALLPFVSDPYRCRSGSARRLQNLSCGLAWEIPSPLPRTDRHGKHKAILSPGKRIALGPHEAGFSRMYLSGQWPLPPPRSNHEQLT